METRKEHDSLGDLEVPVNAYYGVQTQRAVVNFPISGMRPLPAFIDATVHVKRAAAIVNSRLGQLKPEVGEMIVKAADEVLGGKLRDQFVVDVFQAGAGTSHNMNTNEVLANLAIEMHGGKRGDYKLVHPNDDVNNGQSTNDVIPTAIRLASLMLCQELFKSLETLQQELEKKAKEFDPIIKSGRTHLQDAVPVRLGQEFGAYADMIRQHRDRIKFAADDLSNLGIGGSAAGTGLNTHPKYSAEMAKELTKALGIQMRPARNLMAAMQSMAPFANLSGALRNLALDLIKIANDFRLMESGPKTGLGEINLPAMQPGSSIMPGKVNPVMAEMLNMVCFHVCGNDTTVAMAAQAGQLELNVMMPVIAYNLLQSVEILSNASRVFATKCVSGIVANKDRCLFYAENSITNVTVLNPLIGYEKAAAVAKESLKTGKTIREVVLEQNLCTNEQLDKALDLAAMTGSTERSAD